MSKLIRPAPKILPREFYEQKTEIVARKFLGKIIIRKIANKILQARITETEAYLGEFDLASHSSRGLTKRTATMFGPAGHAYVYMIYGRYFCLNIVTEKEGIGSAVLIRRVEPIKNISGKTSGPGLVCVALKIDKNLNGTDVTANGELYLLDAGNIENIVSAPRIGVDYAGDWKDKPLRFFCKDEV